MIDITSLNTEITERAEVAHRYLFPFCKTKKCLESYQVKPDTLFVIIHTNCQSHKSFYLPIVFMNLSVQEFTYTYEQAGYQRQH